MNSSERTSRIQLAKNHSIGGQTIGVKIAVRPIDCNRWKYFICSFSYFNSDTRKNSLSTLDVHHLVVEIWFLSFSICAFVVVSQNGQIVLGRIFDCRCDMNAEKREPTNVCELCNDETRWSCSHHHHLQHDSKWKKRKTNAEQIELTCTLAQENREQWMENLNAAKTKEQNEKEVETWDRFHTLTHDTPTTLTTWHFLFALVDSLRIEI